MLATEDVVVATGTEGDGDALAKEDEGEAIAVLQIPRWDRVRLGREFLTHLFPAVAEETDWVTTVGCCRAEEGYPVPDQGRLRLGAGYLDALLALCPVLQLGRRLTSCQRTLRIMERIGKLMRVRRTRRGVGGHSRLVRVPVQGSEKVALADMVVAVLEDAASEEGGGDDGGQRLWEPVGTHEYIISSRSHRTIRTFRIRHSLLLIWDWSSLGPPPTSLVLPSTGLRRTCLCLCSLAYPKSFDTARPRQPARTSVRSRKTPGENTSSQCR